MGTHLRVLSESYPMNTNKTGFRSFSKIVASLCFGVVSALEGLKHPFHFLWIPNEKVYTLCFLLRGMGYYVILSWIIIGQQSVEEETTVPGKYHWKPRNRLTTENKYKESKTKEKQIKYNSGKFTIRTSSSETFETLARDFEISVVVQWNRPLSLLGSPCSLQTLWKYIFVCMKNWSGQTDNL